MHLHRPPATGAAALAALRAEPPRAGTARERRCGDDDAIARRCGAIPVAHRDNRSAL